MDQKVIFIDEKDTFDVPELKINQYYIAKNNDGQLVDIYDDNDAFIGTFVVERFAGWED